MTEKPRSNFKTKKPKYKTARKKSYTQKSYKPQKLRPTHKQLVKAILEYLAWMGITASETDSSRTYDKTGKITKGKVSTIGWPDISACLPPRYSHLSPSGGRFWAIEVKTDLDYLKPDQMKVLTDLLNCGALVSVPRSVDDVAAVLTGRKKGWNGEQV